ncbi:hypothetical protein [Streptomyces silaceus]|uniref:hypothetical protein n=1 Tax=Streptomyces silaceus TaxID=545123 RepID=UPI0006EB970E|nr:hypothetical protein [Streptomyces silaceus]
MTLTQEQIEVICGIARGHTLHRIARTLRISHGAARKRLQAATRSAGITTPRAQAPLVDYAYREGYLAGLPPEPRSPVHLGPRLEELLDAYARGLTTADIVAETGTTRSTITDRRDLLLDLLGAHSPAHAVALAWQQALTTSGRQP